MPELLRNILLKHLNHNRKPAAFGLADQQVDMLGHDDIASHVNPIPPTHSLQGLFEDAPRLRRGEERSTLVAAEGYEVQAACFLKTFESPRHPDRLRRRFEEAL